MIIIVGDVAVTVKDGVSQLTWIQRYKPIKLQHYKYLSNTIFLSKKTKQIQHVSLLQEVFILQMKDIHWQSNEMQSVEIVKDHPIF